MSPAPDRESLETARLRSGSPSLSTARPPADARLMPAATRRPMARRPVPAARPPSWVVIALAVGAVLVATVLIAGAVGGARAHADDVLATVTGVLAAVVVFGRAAHPGAEPRLPILLLGAGMLANTAGLVVWTILYHTDLRPTFPGAAGPLWVTLPLAGAYLAVSDARRRGGRVPLVAAIDGAIAALAASAVAAAVIFAGALAPVTSGAAPSTLRVLVPLVQIVFVAAVTLSASTSGWRLSPRLRAQGAAALLLLAVCTAAAYEVWHAGRPVSPVVNAAYGASLLLLAGSVWLSDRRPSPARHAEHRATVVIGAFAVLAMGIHVLGRFVGINAAAIWLSSAALLAAVARSSVAMRESVRLAAARRQAEHDELTGLLNRRRLLEVLGTAVEDARITGRGAAVLLVDLDGFKEVNDSLGHHVGDELLRIVAWRVRGAVGDEGEVARLGGDEFCVVLSDVTRESAQAVAVRALAALDRPAELDGLQIDIGASLGIALYPEHGLTAAELLQRADVAMYLAKSAGGAGHAVYTRESDRTSRQRLALMGELRAALDAGEIEVHFQPRHRLSDGHIVGAEALVRWRHPELGLLPPSSFVPAAERSSLIEPLTARVLDIALGECRRWIDAGRPVPVAVNLSVRHLHDPGIVESVRAALSRAHVPAHLLELEVTETMLMTNPARARAALRGLADLGVRIAIDDFGVGHSSLAYLTSLPVAILKIDRCFVKAGILSRREAAVVASVVDLGRRLGMTVVAEGVENASTASWLVALGCDEAQGFHFHRPLDAPRLRDALALDGIPPAVAVSWVARAPLSPVRPGDAGSLGAPAAACGILTFING